MRTLLLILVLFIGGCQLKNKCPLPVTPECPTGYVVTKFRWEPAIFNEVNKCQWTLECTPVYKSAQSSP